jgi:hypothetical protein
MVPHAPQAVPEKAAFSAAPEPESEAPPPPEANYQAVRTWGPKDTALLFDTCCAPLSHALPNISRVYGCTQAEMLYEFAGTNDGELAVSLGEFVYLMDDDGSGWALMMNVSVSCTRRKQRSLIVPPQQPCLTYHPPTTARTTDNKATCQHRTTASSRH